MTRKLFELVGTDPSRPFSPYCWRTRLALAHKGLAAETIPWRFTEKAAIAPYKSEKVPVLLDGDRAVVDSWEIANYLEDAYPDRPSLFGGEGGRASARFLNGWGDTVIVAGIFPMIVADIVQRLGPDDQAYFRRTREARFNNRALEEISADRDEKVEGFRRTLDPLRLMLRAQPFIGGNAPNYGDYIVFGGFQWARAVSPFRLLTEDDPAYAWRERMLDAHGGVARTSPGFAV
jgi:glutathione S-transferase